MSDELPEHPPGNTPGVRGIIQHLQTQIAHQQLSMELYNDAMAEASAMMDPGDEWSLRGVATLIDPDSVRTHLVPGIRNKLSIVDIMIADHDRIIGRAATPRLASLLNEWTSCLRIMKERGELQSRCIDHWLQVYPGEFEDFYDQITALDADEDEAVIGVIAKLNELIEDAGLSGAPWLAINRSAFNVARSRIGLGPLSQEEFNALFFGGLNGARPRMFKKDR